MKISLEQLFICTGAPFGLWLFFFLSRHFPFLLPVPLPGYLTLEIQWIIIIASYPFDIILEHNKVFPKSEEPKWDAKEEVRKYLES